MSHPQDLSVQAFLELRKLFFAADGQPHTLNLRDPFTRVQKEGQGQRGRLALNISIATGSSDEALDETDIEPGEAL